MTEAETPARRRRAATGDAPSARRAKRRGEVDASVGNIIGDGRLVATPLAPEAATDGPRTLVIACGALMTELQAVAKANKWGHLDVTGIPASYHNRPEKITDAVRAKIQAARGRYDTILAGFGDCGTGGMLDVMLAEEGVARLPGAHCYAFFAGLPEFDALQEEEIGSFYLTDFLALHFETFFLSSFKVERHPDLLGQYFANYKRLVHLVQIENPEAAAAASRASAILGLPLVTVKTGFGELTGFLAPKE